MACIAQTTGKPRRASVETALALDEITQRLIQVLVFRGVPQHPRPFAPRPFIDLVPIRSAKDHGGKRLRLPDRIVPSQVQRAMSTLAECADVRMCGLTSGLYCSHSFSRRSSSVLPKIPP